MSLLLALLFGVLIGYFIRFIQKRDSEPVGTVYISFEEDDLPIYLASDISIEELSKHRWATFRIHSRT